MDPPGFQADAFRRSNTRTLRRSVTLTEAHFNPDPKDSIAPSEDVFSYFMLTAPSERAKHGRFTTDACMSYLLVFAALFIQCVLLACVYDKVVERNMRWREGIVNTGKDWNLVGQRPKTTCNDGSSLCHMENGVYTCAPPSVQLVGRWQELDLDGDGVWTYAEVLEEREDLRCKYAVDPVEIFNVVLTLLSERKDFIWLHPDVKHGKAIRKMYFTYVMGDIAMCLYRNEDMCGNLMKRGFFDIPLKHGGVPRVGNTTSSALRYCRDLLSPRGLCERLLPSSYATWKIESVQECGSPEFGQFVYEDPSDNKPKSLLEVDFEKRASYKHARKAAFVTYKTTIIFIWMLLIISVLRELYKGLTWVSQLPVKVQEDPDEEEGAFDAVKSMSWAHRVVLTCCFLIRAVLFVVMLYVGLVFLGEQTQYIDLLFDGVALVFIVQVAEILYEKGLRKDVRESAEAREPMEIKVIGVKGLTSRPDVMDVLWFLTIVLLSVSFMLWYTEYIVHPISDALDCTCLTDGKSCREKDVFSKSFWDDYWSVSVPSSMKSISELKSSIAVAFKQDLASSMLKEVRPYHHID